MYLHNGKTTDTLIQEEKEITEKPNKREHDVLVSVGEQITIAKLAMCLEKLGISAISYTGWQIPIITNSMHGNARIKYINNENILEQLNKGKVVIIAGFQGISEIGDITTLGRGGSDTTAVAIAASLNAERCDIYTDVDGVYSADPRIIDNTKKLDIVSYDEMLELASLGAKVLHNRCVEIGKNYNVPTYVKSTFEKESKGTFLSNNIEKQCISGIAKQDDIVRITVVGKDNKIGRMYKLFKILANNDINVDIIAQSYGEHISKDISFTIYHNDLSETLDLLNHYSDELDIKEINHSEGLSKVSIVGTGLTNNPKIKAEIFELLYENNINMHMISTSEIKISVIVNSNVADTLLKQMHKKFLNE